MSGARNKRSFNQIDTVVSNRVPKKESPQIPEVFKLHHPNSTTFTARISSAPTLPSNFQIDPITLSSDSEEDSEIAFTGIIQHKQKTTLPLVSPVKAHPIGSILNIQKPTLSVINEQLTSFIQNIQKITTSPVKSASAGVIHQNQKLVIKEQKPTTSPVLNQQNPTTYVIKRQPQFNQQSTSLFQQKIMTYTVADQQSTIQCDQKPQINQQSTIQCDQKPQINSNAAELGTPTLPRFLKSKLESNELKASSFSPKNTINSSKYSIKSSKCSFNSLMEDETKPGPVKKTKESEEYEVEKILTYHRESSAIRFLLKWKGWPYTDSTWESKDSLSCPSILEKFQIRLKIADLIKRSCNPNERRFYPYYENQQPHRITQVYKFLLWEDHLNKVCREAGVAPIYVENWIDDECAPNNFNFTQSNTFHRDTIPLLKPMKEKFKCNCKGVEYCNRNGCCSSIFKLKFPYQNNKLINDNDKIVECHKGCECDRYCPGRLVQRGRQVPIVLFRTEFAGWSVRSAAFIPQGTFVMTYLGEVIGKREVKRREDATSFMYDIDTATVENPTFTIDSLHQGNEARFVNHSCDPNLKTYGVLTDRYQDYETLAFFAVKDIRVGTELTIDYYVHVTENLIDGVSCYCSSAKCRKFLMD